MKELSKRKIIAWNISTQISNRPTKNSKGMSFTSERRARGKSIFYRAIISNQKTTKEVRTLSVRGTLDTLSCRNSVTKYNFKRYRKGLKQQQKGIKTDYAKKLYNLTKF